MKHRLYQLLSLLLILGFCTLAAVPANDGTKIDRKRSSIKWTGYKALGQHEGLLDFKDGYLLIKNGKLKGGELTVDMNSIRALDMSEDYIDKLVGHLKSADFFETDAYPTATYKITKVRPQGHANYQILGEMTIKGITKEIACQASLSKKGEEMSFRADLSIDRTDFNVRYGSGSFFDDLGDKAIYDEFDLSITLILL